jgi:hypothetical protein
MRTNARQSFLARSLAPPCLAGTCLLAHSSQPLRCTPRTRRDRPASSRPDGRAVAAMGRLLGPAARHRPRAEPRRVRGGVPARRRAQHGRRRESRLHCDRPAMAAGCGCASRSRANRPRRDDRRRWCQAPDRRRPGVHRVASRRVVGRRAAAVRPGRADVRRRASATGLAHRVHRRARDMVPHPGHHDRRTPGRARAALPACRSRDGRRRRAAALAAGVFDVDAVIEANRHVDALVLQAALVETQARFALDGRTMIALQEAGLPGDVTDLMVALTYPNRFRVTRARARRPVPAVADDWAVYDWTWAAFTYSDWGVGGGWWWLPPPSSSTDPGGVAAAQRGTRARGQQPGLHAHRDRRGRARGHARRCLDERVFHVGRLWQLEQFRQFWQLVGGLVVWLLERRRRQRRPDGCAALELTPRLGADAFVLGQALTQLFWASAYPEPQPVGPNHDPSARPQNRGLLHTP